MPTVKIEPTKAKPVPYDTSDEIAPTLLEELAVAGNTAELQVELGAALEINPEDAEKEQKLLKDVIEKRKTKNLTQPNTAFAAASFLRTYGTSLALDAAQARAAITHKLMELANCGDPRYELKALELLGKHSDIGLFTERSEITINYQDPKELEEAIKERVKRLLNADVIDVTPLGADLDEELGLVETPTIAEGSLASNLLEEDDERDGE
jgi:hypothetical protein